MKDGSGANTWMQKSEQILVQGHPLGPEDYKKPKLRLQIPVYVFKLIIVSESLV